MDKEYWNSFYKKLKTDDNLNKSSSFAVFCQDNFFINQTLNIVELGSGNGRDSIFFVKNNHKVIAIDQSTVGIDLEINNLSEDVRSNLIFKSDDFVQYDYSNYGNINIFYSRFTLHSINEEEEEKVIGKVYNSLDNGGLFCIEVRTIKDKLCGVGEDMGNNTYRTDHLRRFIDSDKFLKKVLNIGFKLKYFTERDNLSIYKDDNPVLMRIVLEK